MASPITQITLITGNAGKAREYAALLGVEVRPARAELTGGFGYDAIFVPAGGTRTFAEMTSAEKNAISHRRLAVQAMKDGLGLTRPG